MVAFYIRLSKADEDVGEGKEESNSVENQRKILYDFIQEVPDLRNAEVEEFVDDGYSGLTFERPAFQRMILFVKQRKVDTIIVKDLSRFGRDYIETGNYLERLFPFMGVRFLSVTEDYDSNPSNDSPDRQLELAMKNIINTYYSKDLSHKIRATFHTKAERAEYLMANRPFGYVQDPMNPGNSIIEEKAAGIVRMIFDLALEGHNTSQITRILNEQNIPTRAAFNVRNGVKGKHASRVKGENEAWTVVKVRSILVNEEYAGFFTGRKRKRVAVGVKRYQDVPQGERIRIPNHHPAIVTPEEFERAQEVIRNRSKRGEAGRRYPLKGKVVCGNCGYEMSYSERSMLDCFFQCSYRDITQRHIGCCTERHEEGMLNDLVFRELKRWFMVIKAAGVQVTEREKRRVAEIKDKNRLIQELQRKMLDCQDEKVRLYESYSDGKLERDSFITQRDELAEEQEAARAQLNRERQEEARLRKDSIQRIPEFEELLRQVALFEDEIILTRTMTETFLEQLTIYDRFHYEIEWKWYDVVERVMKSCADGAHEQERVVEYGYSAGA